MKRATGLIAVMAILVALAGCGSDSGSRNEAQSNEVSVEDATHAYVITLISVMTASLGMAFGQDVPDASLDGETGALTLEGFNPNAFFDDDTITAYTGITGTVRNEDNVMVVELTLEGGPIGTFSYRATQAELQSEGDFTTTVTADGQDLELTITAEDMRRSE